MNQIPIVQMTDKEIRLDYLNKLGWPEQYANDWVDSHPPSYGEANAILHQRSKYLGDALRSATSDTIVAIKNIIKLFTKND